MYRGFNVDINWTYNDKTDYYEIGNNHYETSKIKARDTLKKFIIADGVLAP